MEGAQSSSCLVLRSSWSSTPCVSSNIPKTRNGSKPLPGTPPWLQPLMCPRDSHVVGIVQDQNDRNLFTLLPERLRVMLQAFLPNMGSMSDVTRKRWIQTQHQKKWGCEQWKGRIESTIWEMFSQENASSVLWPMHRWLSELEDEEVQFYSLWNHWEEQFRHRKTT